MEQLIASIQRDLMEKHKFKMDAHYKEGYGVIFVPSGFELLQRNVVAAISETELNFMSMVR